VAEIILFQFQLWLHVKENSEIVLEIISMFNFRCNRQLMLEAEDV